MSINVKALADIAAVLATQPDGGGTSAVTTLASLFYACIERWAPEGSSYRKLADKVPRFDKDVNHKSSTNLRGILKTLERDYAQGMVTTFEQIVHASVFDDLLQQAEYLLGESYTLPAAVIAGSTMEEHLRKLAALNSIVLSKPNGKPKAASEVNDDLHKASAYPQPQWRQNQVWIDLRNEAAHGNPAFAARTPQDIERMIAGVRDLLLRYPA